ncbi:MAG: hypothetical protein ACLGG7_00745 [Bacteriovoracia bacterium]
MGLWIAINYFPFFFAVGLVTVGWHVSWWLSLALLYLLPPLMARLLLAFCQKPHVTNVVPSKESYLWWALTQLQVPFMRFPVLEEVLRMVPGCYSGWLRLWGGKVGKYVYWSAKVLVADRPFVDIGERVVFGYGAKVTAHLLSQKRKQPKLVFGIPVIGDRAIIGSLAIVGPGARVEDDETLRATEALAPFHVLRKNQIFQPDGSLSPQIQRGEPS